MKERISRPNNIHVPPYFLTDDKQHFVIKKSDGGNVVAKFSKNEIPEWEAFYIANDSVNFLNATKEEKMKEISS